MALGAALCLLAAPRGAAGNVTLIRFWAESDASSVTLNWETATELDTVGFRLRRAMTPSGPFQPLSASFVGARGGPAEGGLYRWQDRSVTVGQTYYYRLDSVNPSQGSTSYDDVVCAVPGGGDCVPEPTATRTPTPAPSGTPRPSSTPRGSGNTPRPSSTARPTATPRSGSGPGTGGAEASVTPRPTGSPRPGATVAAATVTAGPAASRAAATAGSAAGSARGSANGSASGSATVAGAATAVTAAGTNPLTVNRPLPTRAAERLEGVPTTGAPPPQALAGAAPSGPPTLVAALAAPGPQGGRGARIGGRSLGVAEDAAPPPRPLPVGAVVAGLGLLLAGLAWRMAQLARRW
ncbi:MAG: hypothetical protein IPL60_11425 [Ardenticatenia bacterium]|nr:hypothetical protein [Ardenticatenia bacterium]